METDLICDYGWLASLVNLTVEEPATTPVTKNTIRRDISDEIESKNTKPEIETTARPFLSLPPEIRNRIYQYVLTINVPDNRPWVTLSRDLVGRYPCLAILETCRQIYHEAWHLFYQLNIFYLLSATRLFHFLTSISKDRQNQIRSIRCGFDLSEGPAKNVPKARNLLRLCAGLKHLHFVMNDVREGHGRRPFRNFSGLETVGIERNGRGEFQSAGMEHRIVAYVMCLTRPRPAEPAPRTDIVRGCKRGVEWSWFDECEYGEVDLLRMLDENG